MQGCLDWKKVSNKSQCRMRWMYADLNPTLIMFQSIWCYQVAPQNVQELSDAVILIWEEKPQDTIHCLIMGMPQLQACIQACGDCTKAWATLWVAAVKLPQNGPACCLISPLWFLGVFEFSPFQVDNFHFYQTMWNPFIPYTLPSLYQYRYRTWSFSFWELVCPFLLSSVFHLPLKITIL